MTSDAMLSVVILNWLMLSLVMLGVYHAFKLDVIMLSAIILSVVAPRS
jgi:hypothetical protein